METIFFSPKTIREFYKIFKNKSKDYEFLIAFILCMYLSKEWGTPCLIGFKLKNKYARDIPLKGTADIKQIAQILRTQIDENTPIDVVIVPGTTTSIKRREHKGKAFQLKRFRGNLNHTDTDRLIEYLNNIPQKYAKSKVSLFIIPENCSTIDFPLVQKKVITNKYPFENIMFMAISQGKLFIGEIWPKPGMNGYDIKKLFEDKN